ncbi:MAG: CvpA family protein [Pseudomonadota bacterium]
MSITILDGIFIALTVLSAFLAMVRGFSREVLSIASWIAAAFAAIYFYQSLTPFVSGYIGNEILAQLTAGGTVFIITLIIATLVTMRIADMIVDSRIGPLDRSLGFVFGAARGVIVVAVGIWFADFFVGDREIAWIDKAKSKPFLSTVAESLKNMLPENLDGVITNEDEATEEA